MPIIKREELIEALEIVFEPSGMTHKEIEELADYVLSFFGYEKTLIDNILSQQDRDIFYTLQDTGILSTSSENITLQKGKPWRIHYWHLNVDKIHSVINQHKREESDIYEKIFKDLDENGD